MKAITAKTSITVTESFDSKSEARDLIEAIKAVDPRNTAKVTTKKRNLQGHDDEYYAVKFTTSVKTLLQIEGYSDESCVIGYIVDEDDENYDKVWAALSSILNSIYNEVV